MRWSKTVFSAAFLTAFSAWKKDVAKEDVYPFSEAMRIDIISYPARDSIENSAILEKGTLTVEAGMIKESVTLNTIGKQKLYSFLFEEDCDMLSSDSRC